MTNENESASSTEKTGRAGEIGTEPSRTTPLRALQGMRHNAHDTTRHTTRTNVACSLCGRILRGAMNSHGKWTVAKHKGCIGHMLSNHKEAG